MLTVNRNASKVVSSVLTPIKTKKLKEKIYSTKIKEVKIKNIFNKNKIKK